MLGRNDRKCFMAADSPHINEFVLFFFLFHNLTMAEADSITTMEYRDTATTHAGKRSLVLTLKTRYGIFMNLAQ